MDALALCKHNSLHMMLMQLHRWHVFVNMTFPITIATGIIFVLPYAGVSLGVVPGFRLDRAGIALTGAALMMAVGAITPEEAYRAINLDTLALLLGMIICVAHLR